MVLVPGEAPLLSQQLKQDDGQGVGLRHLHEEGEQEHEAVHHGGLARVLHLVQPEEEMGRKRDCMVHHQDARAVDWPTYRSSKDKDCQHGEKDLPAEKDATPAHGWDILH